MIDRVAWPVPAGRARGYTRPEKLVSVLQNMGAVDRGCAYVAHGRGRGGLGGRLEQWVPSRQLQPPQTSTAILSPIFLTKASAWAAWVDLYDDWSISPNTNPYYRLLARGGYRAVRDMAEQARLVTVNTTYMANLLAPVATVQIPNGVDAALADIPSLGSSEPRLILLGEFFPGRTDFKTILEVALRPEFSEIVICAPGTSKQMAGVIRVLRSQLGARLQVHRWLGSTELGQVIGERTVVLVPHIVCDYTLSQDLLKVYQFLALGARIICPRMLWPEKVERTYGLLLDRGVDLGEVLSDWLESAPPTTVWRRQFVNRHSWDYRGEMLVRAMGLR